MPKYSDKALRGETAGLVMRLNECIGGVSIDDQIEIARKNFDSALAFTAAQFFLKNPDQKPSTSEFNIETSEPAGEVIKTPSPKKRPAARTATG